MPRVAVRVVVVRWTWESREERRRRGAGGARMTAKSSVRQENSRTFFLTLGSLGKDVFMRLWFTHRKVEGLDALCSSGR